MNDTIDDLAQISQRLADADISHFERVHNRMLYPTERESVFNQIFARQIAAKCMTMTTTKNDRMSIANAFGIAQ